MIPGDRVESRRDGWEGMVTEVHGCYARVAFDNGGSGTFDVADLRRVEPTGKGWPPSDLEAKLPWV